MSFEETHNAPTPTQETGAAEQPETQTADQPNDQSAEQHQPQTASENPPQAANPAPAAPRAEKEPSMEDFATALETFEQEQAQTEAALNEDQIVSGTVLKVTAQYVVVDIGYKSEGVVLVSEFQDHEGNVSVQRGDEIAVMREPGHTEEGYIHLSHQKAQRLKAWDEIEKVFNDKAPVKARVIDRIKGGLTVDILGARAFLPGSQVDLRPVRNLDALKGKDIEVRIIKLNKKRGNIVASPQAAAGRRAVGEARQDAGAVARRSDPDRHGEEPDRLRRFRRPRRHRWPAAHHRHVLGTPDASARPGAGWRSDPGQGPEVRQR